MQQEISNTPTQLFKQVLANSAQLTSEHADNLQALLYSFPQSGVLRALQARSNSATSLNEAAAWFADSDTLQKIVQFPHTLPIVNPAQVVIQRLKALPLPADPEPEPAIVVEEETEASQVNYYQLDDDVQPADGDDEEFEQNGTAGFGQKRGKNLNRFADELNDDTQKLIFENLASNDYFVFDRAYADKPSAETEAPVKPEPQPEVKAEEYAPHQPLTQPAADEGGVTRYHDDKMPYSFMWWLDKTRNKHSGVYQPFAKPAQQVRNEEPPVSFIHEPVAAPQPPVEERKQEEVVERFIAEEPQIKIPTGDKLDSENKAKQSTEDQEELITETLARIYADQTLYSKAIAAYKILMLKYPEKRRYFADHIEVLEKRIN